MIYDIGYYICDKWCQMGCDALKKFGSDVRCDTMWYLKCDMLCDVCFTPSQCTVWWDIFWWNIHIFWGQSGTLWKIQTKKNKLVWHLHGGSRPSCKNNLTICFLFNQLCKMTQQIISVLPYWYSFLQFYDGAHLKTLCFSLTK